MARPGHIYLLLSYFLTSLYFMTQSYAVEYTCMSLSKGDFTSFPPTPPNICGNILDYEVGIPFGSSLAEVEANFLLLPNINTLLSEDCKVAFNSAICTSFFPRCTPSSPTSSAPSQVVIPPCTSLCNTVYSVCTPTDLGIILSTGLIQHTVCESSPWSNDTLTCNSGPESPPKPEALLMPRCEAYTGSVCTNSTPGPIYIPPGYTQEALESIAATQQYTFAVTSRKTGCDILHQAWVCSGLFRECENVNVTPTLLLPSPLPEPIPLLPVGKPPCKAFCRSYDSSCEGLFALDEGYRAAYQPDCNATLYGMEVYPEVMMPVFWGASGVASTSCSSWSSAESPGVIASAVKSVNAVCTAPLVLPDSRASSDVQTMLDGACALQCPLPLFTTSQYTMLDKVTEVGSALSLVAVLFFCVSWALFRSERKNPYYFYMNVSMTVLYTSLVSNSIRARAMGSSNLVSAMCKSNVEEYHFEGYCAVQGAILVFSTLTSVSWWLIQAIDVFRALVIEARIVEGSAAHLRLRIGYHIFAWGPPAAVVAFASYKKHIGAYVGGPSWCFLSSGRFNPEQAPDYALGIFFGPMMAYTTLGVLLMFIVMGRIFLLARVRENRNKPFWERYMCGTYLRIISYFFVVLLLWVFLFIAKMLGDSRALNYAASEASMYTCLLFDQYITGKDCGAMREEFLPLSFMTALQFFVSFSGLFTFLTHSATSRIYHSWIGLGYKGLKKCAPGLAEKAVWCRKIALEGESNNGHNHGTGTATGAFNGTGTGQNTGKPQGNGTGSHGNSEGFNIEGGSSSAVYGGVYTQPGHSFNGVGRSPSGAGMMSPSLNAQGQGMDSTRVPPPRIKAQLFRGSVMTSGRGMNGNGNSGKSGSHHDYTTSSHTEEIEMIDMNAGKGAHNDKYYEKNNETCTESNLSTFGDGTDLISDADLVIDRGRGNDSVIRPGKSFKGWNNPPGPGMVMNGRDRNDSLDSTQGSTTSNKGRSGGFSKYEPNNGFFAPSEQGSANGSASNEDSGMFMSPKYSLEASSDFETLQPGVSDLHFHVHRAEPSCSRSTQSVRRQPQPPTSSGGLGPPGSSGITYSAPRLTSFSILTGEKDTKDGKYTDREREKEKEKEKEKKYSHNSTAAGIPKTLQERNSTRLPSSPPVGVLSGMEERDEEYRDNAGESRLSNASSLSDMMSCGSTNERTLRFAWAVDDEGDDPEDSERNSFTVYSTNPSALAEFTTPQARGASRSFSFSGVGMGTGVGIGMGLGLGLGLSTSQGLEIGNVSLDAGLKGENADIGSSESTNTPSRGGKEGEYRESETMRLAKLREEEGNEDATTSNVSAGGNDRQPSELLQLQSVKWSSLKPLKELDTDIE